MPDDSHVAETRLVSTCSTADGDRRAKRQFTLSQLLLLILGLALLLCAGRVAPIPMMVGASCALWLALLLLPVGVGNCVLRRFAPRGEDLGVAWPAHQPRPNYGLGRLLLLPYRPLAYCNDPPPISLPRCLILAGFATCTVILSWRAVKIIAQSFVLLAVAPGDQVMAVLQHDLRVTMRLGWPLWRMNSVVEAWFLARWWLLFGTLTLVTVYPSEVWCW